MLKKFVPNDFNHVQLLRQKKNIVRNLITNISRSVGIPSSHFVHILYINAYNDLVPRDLK